MIGQYYRVSHKTFPTLVVRGIDYVVDAFVIAFPRVVMQFFTTYFSESQSLSISMIYGGKGSILDCFHENPIRYTPNPPLVS